jgi:KUP system potassium uptake protein
VQRFGTGGIGRFFGPVTLVWFGCWWLLGLPHIAATRRCWWR